MNDNTASEPVDNSLEFHKNKEVKQKQKHKKKDRNGGDGDHGSSSSGTHRVVTGPHSGDAQQNITTKDLKMAMEILYLQKKPAKTTEALQKSHQFWSTQSVPKIDEKVVSNETIEPPAWRLVLKTEPYTLPDGFKWDTLNINEPVVLKELYTLLNENYAEDGNNSFRFDYQMDFLKWALQPPGWKTDFYCGVRVVKSGRLVGFISAVPVQLRIYDQIEAAVEINYLCVHKKLRDKRVAPVLIKEITRRVKLTSTYLAVYTASILLPKPIAFCQYWHRSLNPKKLIDIKFNHLPRNMTMQRTLKLLKLPNFCKTPGFRRLEPQDCKKVHPLLNVYLSKFDLTPIYNEEEFKHWFTPQPDIIDSYVVEAADGSITDFVSYFTLPTTVVVYHPLHKSMKAAYAFYNVSTKTPWVDLMLDALISAKNSGFDVFYALNIMENKEFLEPLKFAVGAGNLHYYLYNWRCPNMTSNKIGLVLL